MESTSLVVGAIIVDSIDRPSLVLGARKATGAHAGLWEFPGGKVEPGEAPDDALRREIREELGVELDVHDTFGEWSITAGVRLRLSLGECAGSFSLGPDHDEFRWFVGHELRLVAWLPTDRLALADVEALLVSGGPVKA